MAEEEEGMERRTLVVPLRDVKSVPRTKRAQIAIKVLKRHVARHMKAEEDAVLIWHTVNEKIWARGRERPPARIRVEVVKFEDGMVEVSLPKEET
ncbi:MAG: 50S ribosomal protein L31e [Candidatus Thermoplasmatota archaeon]